MFSGSISGWTIFKKHTSLLTPKTLSETRRKCRFESIKGIRLQFTSAIAALEEESIVVASVLNVEVLTMIKHIMSFEFVILKAKFLKNLEYKFL